MYLKVKDGDIDAWLSRISWDTLSELLQFVDEEPIGEERADLRMGALASVLWNVNVSTKEIGGLIEPFGYVSGFGKDRVCVLTLKPKEDEDTDVTSKIGTDEDRTLNNPTVWANFKTQMIKYHGGIKK